MKRHIPILLVAITMLGVEASHAAPASHLTTDDMNVLGDATFFGNVTISSGDAVTSDQQLYFSFNAVTNSIIADESGNSHSGTVFNTTLISNGVSLSACEFVQSATSRVSFTADFMTNAGACTYSAWIRLNGNPSNWQEVVGTALTNATGAEQIPVSLLWMNKNGTGTNVTSYMYMSTNGGAGQFQVPCGKPTLYFQDAQWHFVALTWSGTLARHYIDGIWDVATATPTGTLAFVAGRSSLIGNTYYAGTTNQNWKGQIDEVRIYNRCLSENELRALWANGANGAGTANLIVNHIDSAGGIIQTTITATNALMGKTGIGTNAPAEELDVNGKLQMEDNIKLNGHWLSGDGADEGAYVATNGNVGVGTSNITATLHVSGTFRADSGVTYVAPLGDVSMGAYTNIP